MKELSIEEKAKRYDKAKYIMEEYLKSGNAGVIAENTIKHAFPELKESEDERIRKELISDIKIAIPIEISQRYIDWLEKQGEPKPAWSEEDEKNYAELFI